MTGVVLTAYNGSILGPIAKVLGWIMNLIYMGFSRLGIESIVLSIIFITIIIYMCMLPLTIKQQKFSKLQQKMQPEIQAIQNKYKNRKDQASMQAMQQETQLVYEKYGVSPMGSCVQLLIQMPILFALYRVFYNVPAYVVSVKDTFTKLVNGILATDGYTDILANVMKDYNFATSSRLMANNVVKTLGDPSISETDLSNYIVDILYKLPSTGWDALNDYFPALESSINNTYKHIQNFNYFLGLNISDTPWSIMKVNFADKNFLFIILALMIPVLSYLTQVLSMKMMPQAENANDQMAQQMKTMNLMMPLMSFFFCFTVPVGLGIYWIFSAVVRIVQQFFINRHIENLDLEDIIRQNQEKAKKRREKMGIAENQIRDAAAIKTKTIESKANYVSSAQRELKLEKAKEKKANAKPGSMAAKANMVSDFNNRNSRK